MRNRHHEVSPRIAHQSFHLPLVVAFARTPELLREQVMTLQFAERPCLGARSIPQNPRHRQLGVVVQNRPRHSAEVSESVAVTFQKRFRRLGRKRHHEAVVGLRQIHRQVVRLRTHSADHHLRLAEVGLGIPGWMRQRHEHLALAQLPEPHVVLHDRVAAEIAVLVA